MLGLSFPFFVSGQTVFYKYVNKNRNVHFTDRLESIPEQYRDQIKEYKEQGKPETVSPPAQKSGEPADKIKEAEEKKKEAEARALEEKRAGEEKLKAREEKEKRIAELQDQIRAKQEEQRNLRTTWMVYDRIKLNQLNEEIANLAKEVESLQKDVAEDK